LLTSLRFVEKRYDRKGSETEVLPGERVDEVRGWRDALLLQLRQALRVGQILPTAVVAAAAGSGLAVACVSNATQ
jgi:hypothetical protein